MIRQWYAIREAPALAAVVLLATAVPLVAPAPALAQSDQVYLDATGFWRYYNGRWYHYKSYTHGYNPGYYARPDRVLPHGVSPAHYGAYLSPSPPATPRYTYPSPVPTPPHLQAEAAPTALPVYFEVRVPADAEFWFDDARTTQTGTVRRFVSPPVPPGQDYAYVVRARWKEGGNEVTQSRRLTFHAGEQVSITFPADSTATAG
jgi:uncharacterized protein (TIGR03000 family)